MNRSSNNGAGDYVNAGNSAHQDSEEPSMQVVTTVGLDIVKSHIADKPTAFVFVRY